MGQSLRRKSRHYIADQNVELVAGLALFLGGALLLRDAFEGRGKDQPIWMRWAAFW